MRIATILVAFSVAAVAASVCAAQTSGEVVVAGQRAPIPVQRSHLEHSRSKRSLLLGKGLLLGGAVGLGAGLIKGKALGLGIGALGGLAVGRSLGYGGYYGGYYGGLGYGYNDYYSAPVYYSTPYSSYGYGGYDYYGYGW